MKNLNHASCPACGRSIAFALAWARALEPNGTMVLDLDAAGILKKVLDDPTGDIRCGGCGSTVSVGRDLPLAAA